jgi:NTE family protein
VKALAERGIAPRRYVATSLGAVVAAGLAAGLEPDALVRSLMHEGPTGLKRHPLAAVAGLYLPGLLRPARFSAALARMIPARRFSDLTVPLTITAVDVERIESVKLGHGGLDVPLIDALAASCALPPYFPAVELAGRLLRDGGLMGHLPLDAVGDTSGLPVIAVDVGPGLDNGREPRVPGGAPPLVRAVDESIGILMAQGAADQVARWRLEHGPLVYVRPRTERNVTFRTERARIYADEGYIAMRAALDALASGVPAAKFS